MILALYGFLFAAFRELSEHAKEGGFKGWPDWWNTPKSWVNKHNWKPSFLFKTVLVWVTDAEHFFQMLSFVSVLIALLASQSNLESVLCFYGGNVLAGLIKELTRSKTGIR